MRKLIARCPVLYLSKTYKAGDALPLNDPLMVSAWLDAGTAAWDEDAPKKEDEAHDEADIEPDDTKEPEQAEPDTEPEKPVKAARKAGTKKK